MKPIRMTIPGRPITKKNSMRIVASGNRVVPLPSKQFVEYQDKAGFFIRYKHRKIAVPVNIRCRYYMPTQGLVDLVNLLEATDDILVHYGVLADDNCRIVAGHDGSRVLHDKAKPRVEITITEMEDERGQAE